MDMKLAFYLFTFLVVAGCNHKKQYTNTDLAFFNLKGRVKKFAELRDAHLGVNAHPDTTTDFVKFNSIKANYHEFHFDINGNIEKIENIFPSPYAIDGYDIGIKRTDSTLLITQTSPKELYTKRYSKIKDTLSFEVYNKIEDEEFNIHIEKFRKYIFKQNNIIYLANGYQEGKSSTNLYTNEQYAVVTNKNGFDSLLYEAIPHTKKDPLLLYTVTYLRYDEKGNWIKRQIDKMDWAQRPVSSATEYRLIVYYN